MIVLAAAAALVCSQARFEGRASAQLETRARTATGADAATGGEVPTAAADAEVTTMLFGAVNNLGGRVALSYSPTVRMRQPYLNETVDTRGGRRTELNHSQSFEARWRREGRPSPYLLQNFYFGRVDLAAQRTALAFSTGQVSQVMVDVNGGVEWPLTKLLMLDTNFGYTFGTGIADSSADGSEQARAESAANARRVLPTTRAYRGRTRLAAQVSAVDVLTTQGEVTYTEFPGLISTSTFGTVAERWRRQLLTTTFLELGVLVGGIYSSYLPGIATGPADESTRVRAFTFAPGGDAAVEHRINTGAHIFAFEGGARVAPFMDRFLATAFNRGELFTTVAYTFRERWQSSLRGSVGRSLTPVNVRSEATGSDVTTTYVEARTGYVAPRFWRVDLSGQNSTFVVGQSTVNNWIVSLSLTLFAEGQI